MYVIINVFILYCTDILVLLYSHPKYKAALKKKLPFLVCGSTEDPAVKIAKTSSITITM